MHRAEIFSKYDPVLFDAYGTLLDVESLITSKVNVTSDPSKFVTLWRKKQLDYSYQRSLMLRYKNFWELTKDGLDYALSSLNLQISSNS